MAENSSRKKMPFRPVRPHKGPEERQMTERQMAARRRQLAENRKAPKAVTYPVNRVAAGEPGKTRITGLIVQELTRVLAVILKLDGPADVLMKAFFKSNPMLGSRDRTLLAESIFYALRHFGSISHRMAPVKPERAPRLAALLTLALRFGKDSMAEAVIGQEKGPLENMLNARITKAPSHVKADMPEWLYVRLCEQYGKGEAMKLMEASNKSAPLDLRVNLLKAKRDDVIAELAEHKVAAKPTPFSPDGIRLEDKPGLIRWPVYQEGRIDVQDEGSQLIARLVGAKRGEMVCDFCAGAGGKTLAMGALMRSSGRLYAFDINEKRLEGMKPRMRRAGLSNVHPASIRDEHDNRIKRLRGKFDRVLVDAPCTGTGTLRRNPDLKWRLSVEELERINAVQCSVLEEASKLLKPGGRIVYATCSMLHQENQAVVEAFLAAHPEFKLLNATEVLSKQGVTLPEWQKERFGDYFVMLPGVHDTDGFFAAALEKAK